jgi:disulfide bond formation protein DsbB
MAKYIMKYGNVVVWTLAFIGMVGSLLLSEVMGYPPCILCWYQRIFMYSMVFVVGTGILMRDENMEYYALPLSIVGLLISIYHNLLYYGIIPESIGPCSVGVSCTLEQVTWLGFITIPLMSMMTFIVITGILLFKFNSRRNNYE